MKFKRNCFDNIFSSVNIYTALAIGYSMSISYGYVNSHNLCSIIKAICFLLLSFHSCNRIPEHKNGPSPLHFLWTWVLFAFMNSIYFISIRCQQMHTGCQKITQHMCMCKLATSSVVCFFNLIVFVCMFVCLFCFYSDSWFIADIVYQFFLLSELKTDQKQNHFMIKSF